MSTFRDPKFLFPATGWTRWTTWPPTLQREDWRATLSCVMTAVSTSRASCFCSLLRIATVVFITVIYFETKLNNASCRFSNTDWLQPTSTMIFVKCCVVSYFTIGLSAYLEFQAGCRALIMRPIIAARENRKKINRVGLCISWSQRLCSSRLVVDDAFQRFKKSTNEALIYSK